MTKLLTIIFLLVTTPCYALGKTGLATADVTSDWTAKGGGSNYVEIDDNGNDNRNTYVSSTTLNDVDTYTFDDMDIPPDATIDLVEVVMICDRDSDSCGFPGGCPETTMRVVHDSTYEDSAKECNADISGRNFFISTFTYDVTSEESWEPSDFDGQGISFGVELTYDDGATNVRITKIYLRVRYTNAYDDTILSQATISQATIGDD